MDPQNLISSTPDTTPTLDSSNLVTSGGVRTAIDGVVSFQQTINSNLSTNITDLSNSVAADLSFHLGLLFSHKQSLNALEDEQIYQDISINLLFAKDIQIDNSINNLEASFNSLNGS